MKLAYIDSCVWIACIEGLTGYKTIINDRLERLRSDGFIFCASDAVILETMAKPYKAENIMLINVYEELFKKTKILKIFPDVFKNALKAAHAENLKSMDAVHAAIAIRHKCKYFVSTDPHFRNLSNIQFFWINLNETEKTHSNEML